MAALNESAVLGPAKPGGQGVHAPPLFYRAKEKQGIEMQKETIELWPIIPFKDSVPSPNVKCISSPLLIVCIINK